MPTAVSTEEQQRVARAEQLLGGCPLLANVPGDLLARAARRFELKTYARGATLNTSVDRHQPLRLVVWGSALVWRGSTVPLFRSGRMTLLGVRSVIALSPSATAGATEPLLSALALQKLHVLELAPEFFGEVFWPNGQTNALFEPLSRFSKLYEFAPQIVKALSANARLSNVASSALYPLLMGAEAIENPPPTVALLKAGQPPDSYYLALDGAFQLRWPNSALVTQTRDMVGFEELVVGRPLPYDVYPLGCTGVFKLAKSTYQRLFETDPDFQRAIVRGLAPPDNHGPDVTKYQQVVFLHPDPAFVTRKPRFIDALDGLTELMAERLATRMCDDVHVIHLVPEKDGAVLAPVRQQFDPEPIGFSQKESAGGFEPRAVTYHSLPVGNGTDFGALAAEIASSASSHVVLVDPSRLIRTGATFDIAAMITAVRAKLPTNRAGRQFTLSHLTDDPDATPPFELLNVPGLRIVTTAVLDDQALVGGLLNGLDRALQGMEKAHGLTGKLSALANGMRELKTAAARTARGVRRELKSKQQELSASANLLLQSMEALGGGAGPTQILAGARRLAQQGLDLSMLETQPPVWPLGSVRVLVPEPILRAVGDHGGTSPLTTRALALEDAKQREALNTTLERWGRGLTGRRIGLSLGGGGTYGLVHLALLKELKTVNIPIDMLASASVGSTIGAYYALLGEEGLEMFKRHINGLFVAGALSVLTSAFVETWLLLELGFPHIHETEMSFFPVVTDADTGIEWDVRRGTVALAVRASGSLPPLGPTLLGGHRYLDGGLVANVPVNVLREEGAHLVLASNPIASIRPLHRATRVGALPLIGPVLMGLDPRLRLLDIARMIPTIFRTTGEVQMPQADVNYLPKYGDSSLLSFAKSGYVEKAEETCALNEALGAFQDEVRGMMSRRPPLAEMRGERLVLRRSPSFKLNSTTLRKDAFVPLDAIARCLKSQEPGQRITIRVNGAVPQLSLARAQALSSYLKTHGVQQELVAEAGPTQDTESVVFEAEAAPLGNSAGSGSSPSPGDAEQAEVRPRQAGEPPSGPPASE